MTEEERHDWLTAHYPDPNMTPAEFEKFVAKLFKATVRHVDGLKVKLHDKVSTADGEYDFDATVRFRVAGMDLFVIVEAKHHKNAIKRELVQVLYQKVQSVGAHKGVLISTAGFQSGAVGFAEKHGIALVRVTESKLIYYSRDMLSSPPTQDSYGFYAGPKFVGYTYEQDYAGSVMVSTGTPEYVAEYLLGIEVD